MDVLQKAGTRLYEEIQVGLAGEYLGLGDHQLLPVGREAAEGHGLALVVVEVIAHGGAEALVVGKVLTWQT